jgi:diketogulonate reductase-like aldo/keto reductase
VNFLRDKLGVHVTGYSPIGAGGFGFKQDSVKTLNLLEEPTIISLSSKYGKTPA